MWKLRSAEPFVGWNEGINTSASLSYLLGTSFRQLPTNEKKRLDIIPVDSVCRGMTLIGAAIIERRHDPLYQLATSVTNPCDMRRSIELTSLAHRKHYRAQEGLEYWLRLRLDAIPVSKERYNRMSAPAQKAIVKSIQRIMSPLPLKKTPLVRAERNLEKVEKLINLFEPFILHNEHDFVADNVEKTLLRAVPEDEKPTFGYDTRSIDWWDYWINIHIPALAQVDLSSDRRTSAGSASCAQPAASDGRPGKRGSGQNRHQRSNVAIFLTGSTGYIGAHVAANLLEQHGASLNLLVRARDPQEAAGRLWQALQLHLDFPRFYEHLQTRMRIFCGDLTAPQLWPVRRRLRPPDSHHGFGDPLRRLAESQIGKKLPEREPAGHARSAAAGAASRTTITACAASAR